MKAFIRTIMLVAFAWVAALGVGHAQTKLDPQIEFAIHPRGLKVMIPKAGGKLRRLGISAIADRVVQASLKLVLEPIFEEDFHLCSYGFRPNRRAHDAVAEVRYLASRSYEWIVDGDIKA